MTRWTPPFQQGQPFLSTCLDAFIIVASSPIWIPLWIVAIGIFAAGWVIRFIQIVRKGA